VHNHVVIEGPVAATASSKPLSFAGGLAAVELTSGLAATDAAELASRGYVEDEYFIVGATDAFDPDGVRLARDVAYTTRFVVRRPIDVTRASGSVFLDPLHMISEMPASWGAADWLMANGHVWVGVTVHNGSFGRLYGFAGGVSALQQADPERYGGLQLEEFDRPPRVRSYVGPAGTDSIALRWSMEMAHPQGLPIAGAVAMALKAQPLLGGRPAEHIYACGVSQTGNFWRSFLDHGWHELASDVTTGSAFAAYVIIVAPPPAHRPADAVLVNVLSEAELVGTIIQVRAVAAEDSDVPRVRGIELPGAAHTWAPSDQAGSVHDHRHTNLPYDAFLRAVYANLDTWVRGGPPMPHVPRILRNGGALDGLARDEHGNALGGLRAPWLEAPRSQYLPRCPCSPTSGEDVPFEDEVLASLYATDAAHAAQWERAIQRLVEDRLLLAQDAPQLAALRHSL
jgi:hypothetical protein